MLHGILVLINCDYIASNLSGLHLTLVGRGADNAIFCGSFYMDVHNVHTGAGWTIGA